MKSLGLAIFTLLSASLWQPLSAIGKKPQKDNSAFNRDSILDSVRDIHGKLPASSRPNVPKTQPGKIAKDSMPTMKPDTGLSRMPKKKPSPTEPMPVKEYPDKTDSIEYK